MRRGGANEEGDVFWRWKVERGLESKVQEGEEVVIGFAVDVPLRLDRYMTQRTSGPVREVRRANSSKVSSDSD